jgi:hypothetical protein
MTTSATSSFPSRLTKIDELTRGDHSYLEVGDECLFFGDYTAKKSWSHSATNQLILNFKMPVSARDSNRWPHKVRALHQVAALFSDNIATALSRITLVPIPPSKLKSDSAYDNRMMEMLNLMRTPSGAIPDIKELVLQNKAMPAAHSSDVRLPPSEWEKVYSINSKFAAAEPTWIAIIDDTIVTGCRFRAMSNVLKRQFPNARITGLFIARRVPEAIDPSDFFEIMSD